MSALYVHLPWCVKKCPYCDFNSHRAPSQLPIGDYVAALRSDLRLQAPWMEGRRVESIFFGGGTPSLFPPDAIGQVIELAREVLDLAADCEITLEANPGTVEHAPFVDYRAAGVTRVSLGVQSFGTAQLAALGRIHGSAESTSAIEQALSAGFESLNVDLMFGLPDQSVQMALDDIERALELGVPHLSHYQLTLEPNTYFAVRPPVLPDEETIWTMQEAGQARIAEHGLVQYEVSAYARPGHRCRHNQNYWRFGDYLAIGAGAHGKITRAGAVHRFEHPRHPRDYLRCHGQPALRALEPPEVRFDYFLNALRLVEGVSAAHYEAATGLPWADNEAVWDWAEERGMLAERGEVVRLTAFGQQHLNALQLQFLPSEDSPSSTPAVPMQTSAPALR